jgi:large subunit ribosomal protein L5
MQTTYMTLSEKYQKETVEKLSKELTITNTHRVPRIDKIVLNIGLGEAMTDKKVLETMSNQLGLVSGQKPLVTKARRAIATFKLRAGMPIGLKVTLRGGKMWAFLEKLIAIVLPRVRDFRGISSKGFDRDGNLSLGFPEITVFPEVQYETLDKVRGVEVTIVTTAQSANEGKALLTALGMPFEKKEKE